MIDMQGDLSPAELEDRLRDCGRFLADRVTSRLSAAEAAATIEAGYEALRAFVADLTTARGATTEDWTKWQQIIITAFDDRIAQRVHRLGGGPVA